MEKPMNGSVRRWLILAVYALAGAGIYSLPPVVLRGPFFKGILPVETIFASSLVVHVDLSVLVWIMAIGGMLWSLFDNKKYLIFYKSAFYSTAIGTALIALSPLTGNLAPLKNNYIPVLQNPVFFMGLGFFASGMILQVFLALSSYRKMLKDPVSYGLFVAAIITLIAMICFLISALQSPAFDPNNPTAFYEAIFWGGGHILQASYTTLLVASWFILLKAIGYKNQLPERFIYIIFSISLLSCLPAPFFYLSVDATSLFSAHMRYLLGFTPLFAGIAVVYAVAEGSRLQTMGGLPVSNNNSPNSGVRAGGEGIIRSLLVLSILLFGYGGVLAYLISGINVSIPAHYHGSIVGTSLAFMGIVYYFMPDAGFKMPTCFVAKIQPYVYGIGQAMHITGLAIMGGYGALRKDAASSQNIDTILGKALFFTGGSFAILGGLMFVIVMFMAMRRNRNDTIFS
jgi:cytochrome c oxidase subunit I